MTHAREKRLLLGFLALVAPAPLTWNEVLEWPALFVYWIIVLAFLQRADRGQETRLPVWALNGLGLVYLPILLADLRVGLASGRIMGALVHLILFLVVVKLWALAREREKWQLLLAIFVIFLGAMATSSHVTVVLYVVAFVPLGLLVLARFAYLHHLQAAGGQRREAAAPLKLRWPLALAFGLAIAVAIPIFAVAPRYRQPFVFGPAGVEGSARTTGFSDSVDLSRTSSIRNNRDVVLRLEYEPGTSIPLEVRIKGATFDFYVENRWYRPRLTQRLPVREDGTVELVDTPSTGGVDLYLEPLDTPVLPLPIEAVTVGLSTGPRGFLEVDAGGAVSTIQRQVGMVRYRAGLASAPAVASLLDPRVREALDDPASTRPSPDDGSLPVLALAEGHDLAALDQSGVTPRLRELAAAWMGDGSLEERVDRVERHLLEDYGYSTNLVGRQGVDPIAEFLFDYRTGHCELFATAMALMLRSQGVPARLVTGFLGAEVNPFEGYQVVRQSNAHAWVEAYTPSRGWRVYDPTPAEGRPAQVESSLGLAFTQLVDFITFRWDRYVLTFGADDQATFFQQWRERLARWREALFGGATPAPPAIPGDEAPVLGGSDAVASQGPSAAGGRRWLPLAIATLLLAVTAALTLRRRLPTGEAAFLRLRSGLATAGLELGPEVAPLEVERRAAGRFPAAGRATREIVRRYLEESFARRPLPLDERRLLVDRLAEVSRALRDDRRRRRRS